MTWDTTRGQDVVQVNGDTLRFYRNRAEMSQYTVAKLSQLSRSFIAEIEAGRKKPRRLAAESIAEVLRVHVDDLVQSPPEAT